MTDHVPVLRRSPAEVAEYLASHRDARVGAGARLVDGNSVRARLTLDEQDRIDRIIRASEGVYDLEEIRDLGTIPSD